MSSLFAKCLKEQWLAPSKCWVHVLYRIQLSGFTYLFYLVELCQPPQNFLEQNDKSAQYLRVQGLEPVKPVN